MLSGARQIRITQALGARGANHAAAEAPRCANARALCAARRECAMAVQRRLARAAHSSSSGWLTRHQHRPERRAQPPATTSSASARPRRDCAPCAGVWSRARRARARRCGREPAPDHAVELREQAAHEARGLKALGEAVIDPLAVPQPYQEARFAEDFQMPRHARLAVLQRVRQIRDAQCTLGTQRAAAAGWAHRPPSTISPGPVEPSRSLNNCTIL